MGKTSLPKLKRDLSYLKPEKFQDWLTLAEMARALDTDPSWLRRLEKRGDIPRANRIEHGELQVRLWPPHAVDEIRSVLAGLRPGRPSNA